MENSKTACPGKKLRYLEILLFCMMAGCASYDLEQSKKDYEFHVLETRGEGVDKTELIQVSGWYDNGIEFYIYQHKDDIGDYVQSKKCISGRMLSPMSENFKFFDRYNGKRVDIIGYWSEFSYFESNEIGVTHTFARNNCGNAFVIQAEEIKLSDKN